MTKYREILRLSSLGLSQQNIADSCGVSKKTVNRVLKRADELSISWPLDANDTDAVLAEKFFPSSQQVASTKRMPDFTHIRKELLRNGVSKKLLWTEYKTAVIHNGGWKDQQINETYQEMAEHYGTAIIPARVRSPKDKPNAEGTVGNISTWITAALRDEQFFSLAELNRAIRDKLELFNQRLFQKKEGSRRSLFLGEEKPLLAPLPATRFELADWKTATVQFNYHI